MTRSQRSLAVAALTVGLVGVTGCGSDRNADPVPPAVTTTPGPSSTGVDTTTSGAPTTNVGPTSIVATVPAPTPAPTTPATLAPTVPSPDRPPAPTAEPRPAGTAAPGPAAAVSPTLSPPECSAAAIEAATGFVASSEPSCVEGWALAVNCVPDEGDCEGAEVMIAEPNGWRALGSFYAVCPWGLTDSGMPLFVAEQFTIDCDGGTDAAYISGVIKPGETGDRVLAVQAALISRGYDIESDGRYGPRTEGSIRDFQRRQGLEVDGLSGPDTQAALGINPPR